MNSFVSALSQTQTNFSSTTGDIGTAISNFFDSVNQLSTSPADLSLRQGVLTAAGNVATAFNVAANNLTAQRTSLDQSVVQIVGQVNQLTTQIAQLNVKISNVENTGENAGTFIDQRTQLVDQLSSLVDVSEIPSDNSLTLTTASGTALVDGQQIFQLSMHPDSSGVQQFFLKAATSRATHVSGQLGGVLEARDRTDPEHPGPAGHAGRGPSELSKQRADLRLRPEWNASSANNLFTPPSVSGVGRRCQSFRGNH